MFMPQNAFEAFIKIQPEDLTFTIRKPRQQLVLHNKNIYAVFYCIRMVAEVQRKYSISCPKGVIEPSSKITISVVHKDTVSLNTKADLWQFVFRLKCGENVFWGSKYITASLVEDRQPQVVTAFPSPDRPFNYLKLTWPFPPPGSQTGLTGQEGDNTHTQVVPAPRVAETVRAPKTARAPQSSSGWRFVAILLLFVTGPCVWKMAGYSRALHAVGVTTVLRIVAALFTGMMGLKLWWWLKNGVAAEEKRSRGRAVNQVPAVQQDNRASSAGVSLLLRTVTLVTIVYILYMTRLSRTWSCGNMIYIRHGFLGVCGSLLLSIAERLWRKVQGTQSQDRAQ